MSESQDFMPYCGPAIVNGEPVDGCPHWDGSCHCHSTKTESASEIQHFPTAWVDFNGPYWGSHPDKLITLQQHCSRYVQPGDKVIGVCEDHLGWYVVDHLEHDALGGLNTIVCLREMDDV